MVGDVLRLEGLDHRDHPGDVFGGGGGGIVAGRFDPKRGQILKECGFEAGGELLEGHASFPAARDSLVVHVREVHHPLYVESARLEVALQEVFKNVGPKVADVSVVINRRPAGVHFHQASRWVEREEGFGGS